MPSRYGFNNQIAHLCQTICYRAFGITPTPTQPQNIRRSSNPLTYRSSISHNLYSCFRADDFKYCDSGTTPRSIAEELQVHIKQYFPADVTHELDQMGYMHFTPTPQYLAKIHQSLIDTNTYTHLLLKQCKAAIEGLAGEVHYFDYYMDAEITVSEMRRLIFMEKWARVLETVNGITVVRTVVKPENDHADSVDRVMRVLFANKDVRFRNLDTLFLEGKTKTKKGEFRYFGCSGERSVFVQKQLPYHKLITKFLGHQSTQICKLQTPKLKCILSQPPSGLILPLPAPRQSQSSPSSPSHLIIKYGNSLDQFKFQQIEEMLQQTSTECGKELDILRNHYFGIVGLNWEA